MPLPANNTPWPPKEWQPILNELSTWEAWWSGDPAKLWRAYHNHATGADKTVRSGGFVNAMRRFFWGRTTSGTPNRPTRGDLHIPIASDICATSADLLYSSPPTITAENQHGQDTLTRYAENGLFDSLLTGAETGAALGGRYHRVTLDPTVSAHPFLSTVDADSALPEFTWGHLTAVTFWTIVHRDGGTIWRHLERHETINGLGVTYHGLYEGTATSLGMLRPLTEQPATTPLASLVDAESKLATPLTPGLNVAYIPNVTPNRRWRTHQHARHLGRSDLDGLEPLMDALDETYTAWMRDIRLGKARIFADRNMLEATTGHATFDLDQEVFTPLEGLSGSMRDALPIQPQQFTIRVNEHQQTALELTRQIINAARYSQATFGGHDGDTDVTATEVRARQQKTETTRQRKIRLEKPALTTLLQKMLTVDPHYAGTPNVTVQFPELVQKTLDGMAGTVQALRSAQLLSTRTGVEMAHPDWDATQVSKEVQAILREAPLGSPDDWKLDTESE